MKSIAKFVFGLLGLLCLMIPGTLRADTFTYIYTGAPFAYNGANCSPKCVTKVSGYITLSTALASNTIYNLKPSSEGGVITDYSFTDGRNIWDSANFVATDAYNSTSEFSITTGKGDIAAWNINIDDFAGAQFGYYCPGCTAGVISTAWNGSSGNDGTNVYNNYDAYSPCGSVCNGGQPKGVYTPGTWTGTAIPTPEPSGLLLLSAGLAGLPGMWRKRGKR